MNTFKNDSNMPFLLFHSIQRIESYGRGIPDDIYNYHIIEKVLAIPLNNFPLGFETCFLSSRFFCQRYTYEVGSAYWLTLTLDPSLFPWEIAQYFIPRAPSCTSFIPPQQKIQRRFEWNRTTDVESRASFIREWWILRIHNRSCPSSRTLLSTTSFQTKFYHNIPQIWNRYAVNSIMKSWIVIGSVRTANT